MNRCEAILTTRDMTFPRVEGEFFRVIQPLTKTRNIMFIEEPNVNGHEENHTINSFRILPSNHQLDIPLKISVSPKTIIFVL